MAKKTVKPINLDAVIKEALDEYGSAVFDVLKGSVKEVSEEATQKLRDTSPKKSGEYAEAWTYDEVPVKRYQTKTVVHDEAPHYRLTHLLEKGHVSRNGTGRTFGKVKAYPHIAPVNDWANEELPKLVKRKLS